MKKGIVLPIILILFSVVFILAWSPWVTKEFAMFRLNGTSCGPLTVIPIYSDPVSTEKVLFGRKLLEVSGGCGTGTFDYFVSAIGTVHRLTTKEHKSIPTDETTNWKIYTASENSFSFEYPNDWYYKRIYWDNPDKEDSIRFFKSGESETISQMMYKGNEQLILSISKNSKWEELRSSLNPGSESQLLEHKALNYDYGTYIMLDENTNTILNLRRNVAPYDRKLLDKILSTFKFTDSSEEGKFCGGIAGIVCPADYKCLLDGDYPDAGGKCVME